MSLEMHVDWLIKANVYVHRFVSNYYYSDNDVLSVSELKNTPINVGFKKNSLSYIKLYFV